MRAKQWKPPKKLPAIKWNCFELLRSESERPVTGWSLSGVAFLFCLNIIYIWRIYGQDLGTRKRTEHSYRCLGALTVNMFAVFDCCKVLLSGHKTRVSQRLPHIFGAICFWAWGSSRGGVCCGFCKLGKGFIEFIGVTTSLSILYAALVNAR